MSLGIRAEQLRLRTDGGIASVGEDGRLAVVHFFGADAPAEPFDGMVWVRSAGPPYPLLRWNADLSAWELLGAQQSNQSGTTRYGLLDGDIDSANKDFDIPEPYVGMPIPIISGKTIKPGNFELIDIDPGDKRRVRFGSFIDPPVGPPSPDWVGAIWMAQ